MTKKDYYEILGVSKNSNTDEIKKAYKKLAMQFHPDRNKSKEAEEKFKEISEAYAVLSDKEKRNTYDSYGHAGFDQRYSQEDIFRGANFDDIFSEIFGNSDFFGHDIFSSFFGSRRGGKRKGSDLRYDLEISFEEAAFGVTKTLKIPKMVKCNSCEGTGALQGKLKECEKCHGSGQRRISQRTPFGIFSSIGTCNECNGSGEIAHERCDKCHGKGLREEVKEIKVKIPAGVDNNNRIKVAREGEEIKNGNPGDLYLFLHVKNHKFFKREGNDLILEMPVSISQAVLGSEIKIPTLENEVKIKIPSGIQSGTVLRIRGKGIVNVHSGEKGDLLVHVKIEIPKKINKKQKEIFEKLKEEEKKEGLFEKVKNMFLF